MTLGLRRAGRTPARRAGSPAASAERIGSGRHLPPAEPALTWRLLVDSAAGLVSEERAIMGETHLEASSVRLLAAHMEPR